MGPVRTRLRQRPEPFRCHRREWAVAPGQGASGRRSPTRESWDRPAGLVCDGLGPGGLRVGRNPALVMLLHLARSGCIIALKKTRQGYARERILKLAGYSFLGDRA